MPMDSRVNRDGRFPVFVNETRGFGCGRLRLLRAVVLGGIALMFLGGPPVTLAVSAETVEAYTPDLVIQRFEYDISWLGIKAGEASLELHYDDASRNRKTIHSTADSVDWISSFYRVEDRAWSRLESDGTPYYFEIRQREGKYRSHKETFFEDGKVRYINHRKDRRIEKDVSEIHYDVLAAFFHVKAGELVPGKPVFVNMFDSGKIEQVEVKVLKKEKIEVAGGKIETVLIQPVLTTDGLFKHKGKILIWLSDDGRRVPVQVSTEVGLGSVRATLTGGVY